jgi:hypothetical protein
MKIECRNMHGERIKITSTCFEQSYRSSSGGTTLYIRQFLYVMGLCRLDVGRTGIEILPTVSQHKPMTYTNCRIYRIVPPDDER